MFTGNLERAILEALTYSDIFECPLRLDELHRYLPVCADMDDLSVALESLNECVGKQDGFYLLAGRNEIVEIRKRREAHSYKLLPHAIQYGKLLGKLPFVRMVALTGSLAVMNVSKNADFDYMLVTKRGRVWAARLFAMALNRVAGLFGHTLCPNLIVSETALEWPLHDLYSARELCQMIPIVGVDVYRELIQVNGWAKEFLPNAIMDSGGSSHSQGVPPLLQKQASVVQIFLEFLLRGKLGDKLEAWEINRKISRFSKLPGFGEETIFTADVCQGNFHHHRKWTKEVFEEKLRVIASPSKASSEAISNDLREIASSPVGSSQ